MRPSGSEHFASGWRSAHLDIAQEACPEIHRVMALIYITIYFLTSDLYFRALTSRVNGPMTRAEDASIDCLFSPHRTPPLPNFL